MKIRRYTVTTAIFGSKRVWVFNLGIHSDVEQQSGSPEEFYEPSNDSLNEAHNDAIKPSHQVGRNVEQMESRLGGMRR